MSLKTYTYKLYRSNRNKKLVNQIEIACSVYNHCIALQKRYYRLYGKFIHDYRLKNHVAKMKKTKEFSFWYKLDSQAIQEVVERIDKAYKRFFKNFKTGVRPPTFKKKSKYKSFTLKKCGYRIEDHNIVIRKEKYRYFQDRALPEGSKIKTVTVKRDSLGDLYIYVTVEVDNSNKIISKSGKIAGFDFGLKTFLTSSDGEKIKSPLYYDDSISELQKLSRFFAKKKIGSNNRGLAKQKLFRLHKKIVNQRRDFQFKLAKDLVYKYDQLFFEDLDLQWMKKIYGRGVSDLSFNSFLNILEYYCEQYGKEIHYIDRFYPSSKTCSNCGNVKADLQLADRIYLCDKCNLEIDRDLNASLNILKVGVSTLSGETVRHSEKKAGFVTTPESYTVEV